MTYSDLELKLINYGFKVYKTSTKLEPSDIILEACESMDDLINTLTTFVSKRRIFVYFKYLDRNDFLYDILDIESKIDEYIKHNIESFKCKEKIDSYIISILEDLNSHNESVNNYFNSHSGLYFSYHVYIVVDGIKYGYELIDREKLETVSKYKIVNIIDEIITNLEFLK